MKFSPFSGSFGITKSGVLFLVALVLLPACTQLFPSSGKEARPARQRLPALAKRTKENPVIAAFEIKTSSSFLTPESFRISAISGARKLLLQWFFQLPADFPFPQHDSIREPLHHTGFTYGLFYRDELIETGTQFENHLFELKRNDQWHLEFVDDEVDLEGRIYTRTLTVPLLMLHDVPAGRQKLRLKITQHAFFENIEVQQGDTTIERRVWAADTLLSGEVVIEFDMVPVKASRVKFDHFTLRDDETYNPETMDFALFKPGYPDLYWLLKYPPGNPVFSATRQRNVRQYNGPQEFVFYHYTDSEPVEIVVLDYDFPSKDDMVGRWSGIISDLQSEEWQHLSFEGVKNFDVKIEETAICNE